MNYQVTNFDCENWDRIIAQLPGSHILQTWEWGAFKSQFGWEPVQLVWYDDDHIVAASLVLKRCVSTPFFSRFSNIFYIPKGPLLDWSNASQRREVLIALEDYAKDHGALFTKIDPDIIIGTGLPGSSQQQIIITDETLISDLKQLGWFLSTEQIQFKNTVQIDLSPDEEILLANMKQKTRYNIRLATRKGVTVRTGTNDDMKLLYRMYAETSLRDGFIIRSEEYYQSVWREFIRDNREIDQGFGNVDYNLPHAEPLIAEVDGEPVAAVIIFRFAGKAWYMYGMSRAVHRERMPNHLLQWEAMRRAKAAGCHTYDLWGAPEAYDDSDPLWGVYQFKEGFGGKVVQHLGAWDRPIKPTYYKIYNYLLPRILAIMRRAGRKSTKHSVYN
jgi:peptidoglycan pentaglycine glycine transferase (the first glycine)